MSKLNLNLDLNLNLNLNLLTLSLAILSQFPYIFSMKTRFNIILLLAAGLGALTAGEKLQIGRLKYEGGGDWYSNPGSLENLARFIMENTDLKLEEKPLTVTPSSPELFRCTYIYMNGHGNVKFSPEDRQALRYYLEHGGFLHADDNYGMDASFRREMKTLFPDKSWVELPFDHPVYRQVFNFPKGLPKIHEHDNKPPQGLGLFHNGRLIVFYSYESDLGDGWEDEIVHHDPDSLRREALKMGTNLFYYHLKP